MFKMSQGRQRANLLAMMDNLVTLLVVHEKTFAQLNHVLGQLVLAVKHLDRLAACTSVDVDCKHRQWIVRYLAWALDEI